MLKSRIILILKLLSPILVAALLFSAAAGVFTPPPSSGGALQFEEAFANGLTMGAELKSEHFIYILMCLFPFTLFEVMFGSLFSNDFTVTCVYVFTRGKSRTSWYLKKCAVLFVYSVVFAGLFFAGGFAVLIMHGAEITGVSEAVWVAAKIASAHALIYFTLALILNILTVVVGSSYAFTAVNAVLAGMVFSVLAYDPENLGPGFRFNFIANLIPSWHNFSQESWLPAMRVMKVQKFDHSFTIAYFAVICLAVLICGLIIINRMDISIQKKEDD